MSEPHTNHPDQGPQVHRITEAQESHAAEQHSRVMKYTISMSVRLACFIAAFFVHGWLQWVFLAGAIVLPYIAVVIANGGADLTKRQPPAEFFTGDEPRLLTSGAPAAGTGTADSDHVEGEVFTVNEDGEAVPESTQAEAGFQAATPDPGHPAAAPAYEHGPFPAEAPTTIDGSFVEDPAPTGTPAHAHRPRGGTR